ncbi:trypsin-like serine peptidase [Roseiconus lacunae]|uniref:trypsin-like serine peptidase n=1 Tax=Roseiconus lacunae TaxID=2605694 RepID=UPI001E5BF595|nr:serine protease [Roseiconus lacunae]MCD0460695.1 serine protease [Roseiconus lacunae]
MYFQISASIAEDNAELKKEIEFVDSMLDEAEAKSVYQAIQLARISRLDVNRIETVLDLYVVEKALSYVEMLKCEQCNTLAEFAIVDRAIRDEGVFECSICDGQIERPDFDSMDVVASYHFDPSKVSRATNAGAANSTSGDSDSNDNDRPQHHSDPSDLSERESRIVTELLLDCFESVDDVRNFASDSSARPFRQDLETKTLRSCVRSLIEQAHRRELLGEVVLDLERLASKKREQIVAIANHIEAKYEHRSQRFRKEISRLVESSTEPRFDLDQESFLEEATSRNPFLDLGGLRDWLDDAELRVCRVRGDVEDLGTGFLIAKDLILTCHHVVDSFIEESDREYLSVCFDQSKNTNEMIVGVDPEWDIPHSKPSVADELGTDDPPAPDELDFAILKLSKEIEKERGIFSLHDTKRLPLEGDPILIAGHPGPNAPLQHLKFSMASPGFVGLNDNETRMIYKTSTLKGSSGSPVFNRKFQLIGLHHNRGEQGEKYYQNNRGIPVVKIVSHLQESKWKSTPEIVALLNG